MSSEGQCRLFVAGFPRNYESSDLEKKFASFGEIKEVLMKKGFAFVEFVNP
jgi:arginine/serine-rich splicing factor 4/5/6